MTSYDNFSPEIPGSDINPNSSDAPTAVRRRRGTPRGTAHESNPEVIAPGATVKRSGRRKPTAAASSRKTTDSEKGARKAEVHEKVSQKSLIEKTRDFFTSQTTRWICGIVLGTLGVYLLVAFVSYFFSCFQDQAKIVNSGIGMAQNISNRAGEGGARLSEFFINYSFGVGSFVIVFWLGMVSLKLLSGWPKFKTVNFTIKCLVALITVSLIVGLLTLGFNSPVNWGGYHGRYVNAFIVEFLGWSGAVLLCLMLVAIFVVICMRDVINWVIRKRREYVERQRAIAEAKAEEERKLREMEEMRQQEELDAVRAGESVDDNTGDSTDAATEGALTFADTDNAQDDVYGGYDLGDDEPCVPADKPDQPDQPDQPDRPDQPDQPDQSEQTDSAEQPAPVAQADTMVVNVNSIDTVAKTERPAAAGGSLMKHYKFPPTDILREGSNKVSVDVEEQDTNKNRIRETLLYHNIPITNIEATVGPTVTLYEIRPEQGIKISKIKNLADDIALSLSAIGVRIIAPIPGKGTVGIEVANNDPQTVSMRTIIQSRKYSETRYKLPVALGSTIGNDVYIADLAKMPHLLVAGATGQGKSVGLNAIIASLLYKKRPDELKFVMIDPKEVEFSLYAKIEQHYLAKLQDSDPIVTDMSKVVSTLNSLCEEMDQRYKLLRTAQVRNIEEYNAKWSQNRLLSSEGHRFLPYIVVVVDEFADLIMTAGKEVENPIARLAQKARAIGIHVIIATQRPSTNVITGIIKANFPVRIAFKVSSGVDSKTILDTTGAQQLIGRGDMLISNNSEMVRVQCAFIDTPEVEEICNFISKQPFNQGAYILPEPPADGPDMPLSSAARTSSGSTGGVYGDRDPLFEEAAALVVHSNSGSTSYLQRHFSLGYARAGKIMDQLELAGVVGPATGGKPRDVLMDTVGLENLLNN